MTEYIKREDVLAMAASEPGAFSGMVSAWDVAHMPAADVAPVVHAAWVESSKMNGYLVCSGCHNCYVEPSWPASGKWRYCPECGAKMRGGDDNEAD